MDYEKYYGGVYITTNHKNGKRHIGKVVFSRQNDWQKYLGSGLYLKRAIIAKHGKENFSKEIICLCETADELNSKEEEYITKFDAVNSKDFYNIKLSSIGGDIFTNHPEKERIRKLRQNQMSGEGNHQYGKPKTEKMIESVKKANSKAVYCDGIYFESVKQASEITGIKETTLCYRLKSNSIKFVNYQYHAQ